MLLTASIGLGSAAALLCAGYLLGSHRGVSAREKLREQGLRQTYELQNLRSLVTREDDRAEIESPARGAQPDERGPDAPGRRAAADC